MDHGNPVSRSGESCSIALLSIPRLPFPAAVRVLQENRAAHLRPLRRRNLLDRYASVRPVRASAGRTPQSPLHRARPPAFHTVGRGVFRRHAQGAARLKILLGPVPGRRADPPFPPPLGVADLGFRLPASGPAGKGKATGPRIQPIAAFGQCPLPGGSHPRRRRFPAARPGDAIPGRIVVRRAEAEHGGCLSGVVGRGKKGPLGGRRLHDGSHPAKLCGRAGRSQSRPDRRADACPGAHAGSPAGRLYPFARRNP